MSDADDDDDDDDDDDGKTPLNCNEDCWEVLTIGG